MLTITQKCSTAVRALAELERRGGTSPVPIAELARARDIPVQVLEGLFATLRRGGVIQSQRGVKGGYSFARPPSEITVLEVVELLEGGLELGAAGDCSVWREAVDAVRVVLGGVTIVDAAERESSVAGAAMYHI